MGRTVLSSVAQYPCIKKGWCQDWISPCCAIVAKFKDQLGTNRNYQPERTSAPCFTINHYAGNIKYTSHGFLARNRDELSEDVIQVRLGCL